MTGWCTGCLRHLPASAFRACGSEADSKCRACHAETHREWRARNPEAVAAYNEARRIGPRECTCVVCGAVFTAGERGPASTRCKDCRTKAKRGTRRRPRVCEVCGDSYRPTYGAQRTCGRECGVVMRARKAAAG
jgi:hypothetical protein